jgi:hypothetical protein
MIIPSQIVYYLFHLSFLYVTDLSEKILHYTNIILYYIILHYIIFENKLKFSFYF